MKTYEKLTDREIRRDLRNRWRQPPAKNQGQVIIEKDQRGYLMMFPNGDICWQPSKQFAEKKAVQWFKENCQVDISIGKIEWR